MLKQIKVIAFISLVFSTHVMAEYYKVEVTRLDSNLYKTSDGFYIETKFCHEYARSEEAILSYEQYLYDNKLIFKNSTSCDVKRVFK